MTSTVERIQYQQQMGDSLSHSLRGWNISQYYHQSRGLISQCPVHGMISFGAWHFQLQGIENLKCHARLNHQHYSNCILLFAGYFLRLYALVSVHIAILS
jgi:hypothetical protein